MMPTRQNIRTGSFLLFLLSIAGLLGGCVDDQPKVEESEGQAEPAEIEFAQPTFTGGRRLDTLFTVDLDDDGRREYVVASIDPTESVPTEGKADLLTIYRLDEAKREWVPIINDTLLWISSLRLIELTGDRAPEIVADVSSGGNDPIASLGMTIYTGEGKAIRKLWEGNEGTPRIEGNRGGLPFIAISKTYWPVPLPHVEAVPYVEGLISLKGGKVERLTEEFREHSKKEAEEVRKSYEKLLTVQTAPTERSEEEETDLSSELYATTVQLILALDHAGMTNELRELWHRDEEVLSEKVGEENFELLEELYTERIMH